MKCVYFLKLLLTQNFFVNVCTCWGLLSTQLLIFFAECNEIDQFGQSLVMRWFMLEDHEDLVSKQVIRGTLRKDACMLKCGETWKKFVKTIQPLTFQLIWRNFW